MDILSTCYLVKSWGYAITQMFVFSSLLHSRMVHSIEKVIAAKNADA